MRSSKSAKTSRDKHIKYMNYFIKNWNDLSNEIKTDRCELKKSITNLHNIAKQNEQNMDRLLNDADSSMIQLFTKRMEEINGQMSEGEKYERLKEFKEYLADDFNMSNFLLESYIDDELGVDNNVKMLRYDRIIMKYTTKFKLTKKQRIKYSLHEPVIDTTEKIKLYVKE